MFLLTTISSSAVFVVPKRLVDTSDVSILFMFLFQLFLFSLCSISVLGSPVFAVSISANGLSGLARTTQLHTPHAYEGSVGLSAKL